MASIWDMVNGDVRRAPIPNPDAAHKVRPGDLRVPGSLLVPFQGTHKNDGAAARLMTHAAFRNGLRLVLDLEPANLSLEGQKAFSADPEWRPTRHSFQFGPVWLDVAHAVYFHHSTEGPVTTIKERDPS